MRLLAAALAALALSGLPTAALAAEPARDLLDGRTGTIHFSSVTYVRKCQSRGATIGGDSEARRRAPDDLKTFLERAFGP